MQGPNRTKRKAASPQGQGAKYRLIGDGYFPGYGYAVEGTELFSDGIPGRHMEPLNAAAEKAYNAMAEAKGLPKRGESAPESASVKVTEVPKQPGSAPTDADKAKVRPV